MIEEIPALVNTRPMSMLIMNFLSCLLFINSRSGSVKIVGKNREKPNLLILEKLLGITQVIFTFTICKLPI